MRFVHCVVMLACLIYLNGAIAKLESSAVETNPSGKGPWRIETDPQLNEIVSPDAVVKVLAGFSFIEGQFGTAKSKFFSFLMS